MAGTDSPGRSSRGFSWWFSVGVIAVLIGAGLYGLTLEWVRPTESVRSARVSTSSNTSAGLVVAWGVRDNLVREGDSVSLWFQFLNQSKPITDVGFAEFNTPGFVRAGDCWEVWPKCTNGPQRFEKKKTLASGESLILTGDLLAHQAGRYNLTAIYSWRNAAGFENREAVTLGPIEVASGFQVVMSNLFGRMAGFILPLSLALAGAGLQLLQKKYDDSRRTVDDERARAASVLNTLLPTQMEHTRLYYQPLVSRVATLCAALDSWTKKTDAEKGGPKGTELADEIAYDVAMILRQRKFLIDHLGGIHLQSRNGEKLLRLCWLLFQENLKARMPATIIASVNRLPTKLDMDGFAVVMRTKTIRRGSKSVPVENIVDFVKRTRTWLRDPNEPLTKQLSVLLLIRTLLVFEINRPFERWYDSKEKFPRTQLTAYGLRLSEVPDVRIQNVTDSAVADARRRLEAYIEENGDRPAE